MIRRLLDWAWRGEPWRGVAYWRWWCERWQQHYQEAMDGWMDEIRTRQELARMLAARAGSTPEAWTSQASRDVKRRTAAGGGPPA